MTVSLNKVVNAGLNLGVVILYTYWVWGLPIHPTMENHENFNTKVIIPEIEIMSSNWQFSKHFASLYGQNYI